jgi:UDP-galactose transporter B1
MTTSKSPSPRVANNSPKHHQSKKQPNKPSVQPDDTLLRLILCFFGINICYLYYGVLQERISRPDSRGDKLNNTLFLFWAQACVNGLLAFAGSFLFGSSPASKSLAQQAITVPSYLKFFHINGWIWVAFISLSYLGAMLSSHEALSYVSYPAQALAKSCKMVPVMLGNVLVGIPYRTKDLILVGTITIGISIFQWDTGKSSSSSSSNNNSATLSGYLLLFLSLCLDGVTSSHQHLLGKEFKLSTHNLMLGMNGFSFLYLSIPLFLVGNDGMRGIHYLETHPGTAWDVFWFALCSALGQTFIFLGITGPGPLAVTTITTTRKFFTILLSVLLYSDNALKPNQWLGVLLVFAGLSAEILDKYRENKSHGGRHNNNNKATTTTTTESSNNNGEKKSN